MAYHAVQRDGAEACACQSYFVVVCTHDNECNTPANDFEKWSSLGRDVVKQQQQQQPFFRVINREFYSQADVSHQKNHIKLRTVRVVGPAAAAAEMRPIRNQI